MHHISGILKPAEVADLCARIDRAEFVEGALTGGEYGKRVKHNMQIKPTEEVRTKILAVIQNALYRNPEFFACARPLKMVLKINRYEPGMDFGNHNDAGVTGTFPDHVVRTDLSMTLFLADPGSYDGGELVMVTPFGEVPVKLPAGDAIVYPSSMIHRVEPVTRGVRLGAFAWMQSMIRDEKQRDLLFKLDQLRRRMAEDKAEASYMEDVSNTYHNLMRMWAED